MALVEVKLTIADVTYATIEAVERYNFNRDMGNDSYKVSKTWPEAIAREINGVIAEIAVARWKDKYPITLFADRKSGDVGEFEVRSTAYSYGKLLFQPDDNKNRRYFFVTVDGHYKANIVGWLWGWEGIQDQFWDTNMPVPCYAVPQSLLHDPEELD